MVSLLFDQQYTCRKCKNPESVLIPVLGYYLAFDVEHFYVNLFKPENNDLIQTMTKEINNLPLTMVIQQEQYTLTGVIGFNPAKKEISHYVAYVRESEFWEMRDDLQDNGQKIPVGYLNTYIALIIYVRTS